MPRTMFVVICLALSCSGQRGGAPADSLPQQTPAASSSQSPMTPGVCGYRELADSASREACRQRLFNPKSHDVNMVSSSDCAYHETMAPDSLVACLLQADAGASRCPLVQAWRVRQPDGVTREAEWRRCGPQGGATEGDSIVWPLEFLVVRKDSSVSSPAIFVYSNAEEPGVSGLDTVMAIDFDGDGTDELFFVDRIYGTGAAFEECALTVSMASLRCWSGPDFPDRAQLLRPGEALFKGWIRTDGGPGVDRQSAGPESATGEAYWYFSPVYREDDANCCPSANASLWIQVVPGKGRFQTGLVLRATEDSNQAIMSIDTLQR